ncbi:MAG: sodium/proline symporter [Gemmatimonadota bacterium]
MNPSGLLQTTPIPVPAEPAVLAFLGAYFALVLLIGAVATRRTRTARDFFLAGRGIGLVALSVSAVAATLSGFTFIGGPGLMYTVGLGALFIILPAGITNAVGAWVLAKRLRLLAEVRDVMTLPDAIGARYRSPAAQGLAGASVLLAVVGYMATNVLAMGVVLQALLGTSLAWGIWIGAGVTLLYTAGGGIRAAIWTDLLQGAVMGTASVLVFLYVLGAGGGGGGLAGLSTSILAEDPGFLEPWGHIGPLASISFFFVFSMGVLGQPHVLHKFYMLREPRLLRWYPLLSALALCLSVLLFFGVGLAVKGLVVAGELPALTHPDQATPLFLLERTPILLAALVFSGVVAAIMSTLNSFMNVGAAALVHDLPVAVGRRIGDELLWGRVATVGITVAAAGAAQLSGTLVAFLGIFGWGLFASTLVPALAVGMNWEGATRAGAIASISVGLVGTIVLEVAAFVGAFTLPTGITIAGLTLVTSFLAFFGVSCLTRDRAAGELDPDLRVIIDA